MVLHYLAIVLVGFVAGLIARFIMPGPNNPSGFILTTILGIVGSLIANFIAVKVGWAAEGQGVGLLSGVVGAIVLLFVYHLIERSTGATV